MVHSTQCTASILGSLFASLSVLFRENNDKDLSRNSRGSAGHIAFQSHSSLLGETLDLLTKYFYFTTTKTKWEVLIASHNHKRKRVRITVLTLHETSLDFTSVVVF